MNNANGITVLPPQNNNEMLVWKSSPEWKAYALYFAIAVLTIPTVIVPLIIVLAVVVDKYRYHYKVTNKRIICTYGLLNKKTNEIDINDIRSTNVTQGFIERFLNIGSLEFATASGPIKEAVIVKISDPQYIKEKIRSLRNN